MPKSEYQEIINEYKEQVRILKEQVNELTDACKAKDSALKRALQKLEYTTEDLDKMIDKEKEHKDETKQ
jgi:chromosome segregation ATPase|tara:strand:- start:149 stop:355 length:207 start_codon:yes stop_codon:yes gene_type:complete